MESCEFVWPVDPSLILVNGQIMLVDSGIVYKYLNQMESFLKRLGNNYGQLNTVSGLYIDSMSNIFVVDRLNHRLQVNWFR